MKVTAEFNKVPEALIEKTKLKKGEIKVFRLANLQPDPVDREKWAIPYSVNVPPTDEIFDPTTGGYYQIAAIKSLTGGEKNGPTFHDIFFTKQNAGQLILNGGNAIHQEIYSYLTYSNRNASNPNRDVSYEPVFELVDEAKKATENKKNRNTLRDALNAAADMKPQEIKDFVASLGNDDTRDLGILRDEVETFASKDPATFLEKFNNKQNVVKATIKRAQDAAIITFNLETSTWYWATGEVINTVARTGGSTDHIEGLLAYCLASKKGEAVYQEILKLSKQ